MKLLATGVLLWSAVHLLPGVANQLKLNLVARMGRSSYRGLFSLLIVLSLVLIVIGWRGMAPALLYSTPESLRMLTAVLMLVALMLFVSARLPTDIKRVIRHPQLTGVILWAIAHLLSNGDSRSLLLFGGIGLWALAEILVVNHRDGAWIKPQAVGTKRSLIPVVIGVAAWLVLAVVHPWISGVSVIPGH